MGRGTAWRRNAYLAIGEQRLLIQSHIAGVELAEADTKLPLNNDGAKDSELVRLSHDGHSHSGHADIRPAIGIWSRP
jgi:hypothetical protein